MDPWSSNDWLESDQQTIAPSSTLPLDLDLRPTYGQHPTLDSHNSTWPTTDLNLPDWDNPSPPRPSSPDHAHPPFQQTQAPPPDHPPNQLDQFNPSNSIELTHKSKGITTIQTSVIDPSNDSPTTSSDTTGFKSSNSSGSDQQWAETNQSPIDEAIMTIHQSLNLGPDQPSSSIISPSIPTDPPHQTQPESDPDDDRWGTFTQTDIPSIPSVIPPLDQISSFRPPSPIHSGWDGETNLGGWDHGVTIDNPFSIRTNSISIPGPHDEDDEDQIQKAWSSSPPSGSSHLSNDPASAEDWENPQSTDSNQMPSTSLGQQQLAARQWAQDQFPIEDENFLPPGKVATPLDLSSALNPGGELAGTFPELFQDPLPDTSATRTQLLYQNSATAEAFQTAMSKTASAAASVLKPAPRPRRFFPNTGTNSVTSQLSSPDASNPEKPTKLPDDNALWGDFSALEIPHHPHDPKSDAFSAFDSKNAAQKQQQAQNKRSSFFGLWTSKPPPPTNTPSSLLTKKKDNIPYPLSIADVDSFNKPRGSISSSETPSTGWPAPSPASPTSESAPSTIARLLGRFGSRPANSTSVDHPKADDPAEAAAALSTDLNAQDIKFLDCANTVPVKPATESNGHFPIKKKHESYSASTKDQGSRSQVEFSDLFLGKVDAHGTSSPVVLQSSGLSSSSKNGDHFGFLDSLSSDLRYQKSVPAGSATSTQMGRSNSNVSAKSVSNDDFDNLFSHFEGSRTSSSKILSPPAAGLSIRLSNHSTSSTGLDRPSSRLLNKETMRTSSSSSGIAKVRMSSKSPTPILSQGSPISRSSSASNATAKIPILAPPPRNTSSSPVPFIPPPGNNHHGPLSSLKSQTSSPIPPNDNNNQKNLVNKNNIPVSSTPAYNSPTPVLSTTVSKPVLKPSTQSVGLSKEDLDFFDSLM